MLDQTFLDFQFYHFCQLTIVNFCTNFEKPPDQVTVYLVMVLLHSFKCVCQTACVTHIYVWLKVANYVAEVSLANKYTGEKKKRRTYTSKLLWPRLIHSSVECIRWWVWRECPELRIDAHQSLSKKWLKLHLNLSLFANTVCCTAFYNIVKCRTWKSV